MPRSRNAPSFVDGKLLLAVLSVGALFVFAWFSDPFSRSAVHRSRAEADGQLGAARHPSATGRDSFPSQPAQACRSTLSRVLQGGSVSAADAEGWRVEIALLKQDGNTPWATHPSLARFVEDPSARRGSKYIGTESRDLATVDTPDTRVRVLDATLTTSEATLPGITLSFGGTYVDSYFSEEGRPRYFAIAHALSEALDATHSAVYARCFDSEIHTLGGWFRGSDPPGVATALIYFIGTYARPPHIASPFLRPPGAEGIERGHAFRSIQHAARHLDRDALATLAGSEGGMAMGKPGEPISLTFPFRDGNRASRVSRTATRVLNLNR